MSLLLLLLSLEGLECFVTSPCISEATTATTATTAVGNAGAMQHHQALSGCHRRLVSSLQKGLHRRWLSRRAHPCQGSATLPRRNCRSLLLRGAMAAAATGRRTPLLIATTTTTTTPRRAPLLLNSRYATSLAALTAPTHHTTDTASATGSMVAHDNPSTSSSEDTIFALSTGNSGPAGVAVVRISGPRSAQVLEALTSAGLPRTVGASDKDDAAGNGDRSRHPPFPAPRRAVVRRLYDPVSGDLLDEALVLWMPGPRRLV